MGLRERLIKKSVYLFLVSNLCACMHTFSQTKVIARYDDGNPVVNEIFVLRHYCQEFWTFRPGGDPRVAVSEFVAKTNPQGEVSFPGSRYFYYRCDQKQVSTPFPTGKAELPKSLPADRDSFQITLKKDAKECTTEKIRCSIETAFLNRVSATPSQCYNRRQNSHDGGCYSEFAVRNQDPKICNFHENSIPAETDCLLRVAVYTNDAGICEGSEGATTRDYCFLFLARYQKRAELCRKIASKEQKSRCEKYTRSTGRVD